MLYLISGLGADERIFGRLSFLEKQEHKHLQWVPPNGNNLKEYALRLSEQIDRDEEVILMGVSFGGMVAVEISKILPCKKVILISSAATKQEIPSFYRFFGKLKLHILLPSQLLKWANPVTYFLFGMYQPNDKTLLKNILQDTDAPFLKWAINAILQWNNKEIPANLLQIHGMKDWVLPCPKTKNIIKIQKGGYLMVWTEARQIDDALKLLI
ncbi:MAG: alpha/beta hydrolase [Chitinophagales bacterium]